MEKVKKYWNKDLFTAAGLDPDTPPATWDEWAEYATKLTDASKNVYGSGISYDYAYQIAHIMQRFGGLAVTDEDGTWTANFENNEGYKKFLNMYMPGNHLRVTTLMQGYFHLHLLYSTIQ